MVVVVARAVAAAAPAAAPGGDGGEQRGKGGTLQKGSSGKASRSIEEIKLVFERNKGAIYALYNRALRDDPALQGKVVLELKIAPSGQVEGLRIISSELKAEELEKKLLARIRQFDFGAKDVDLMVVTWPVDFSNSQDPRPCGCQQKRCRLKSLRRSTDIGAGAGQLACAAA
jgi:TonB family protein